MRRGFRYTGLVHNAAEGKAGIAGSGNGFDDPETFAKRTHSARILSRRLTSGSRRAINTSK